MQFKKITLVDEAGNSVEYTLLPVPAGNEPIDDKYISKYVSYQEVVRSTEATKLGIDNTPNADQLEAIRKLCRRVVDPAREAMGAPVFVNSCFRSKALNKSIKGASNSQHMAGIGRKGAAIDLDNKYGGFKLSDLFKWIRENVEFDQLIWEYSNDDEPGWVHVSYAEGANRGQVLKSYKDSKGKTLYKSL